MASDYTQGNGKPDCPDCQGRGAVPIPKEDRPPGARGPITRICDCILVEETLKNMERGWVGLANARPLQEASFLREYSDKDLWLTAMTKDFREHLRHIAARKGPDWYFSVVSDAQLMDAWLAPDIDVRDMDVDQLRRSAVSSQFARLVDRVEPPALLIVQVGVKAARNKAMPEVLLEALRHRAHIGKPTWVVDNPFYRLTEGHISYSPDVGRFMNNWDNHLIEPQPMAPMPVRDLVTGEDGPPPPARGTPDPADDSGDSPGSVGNPEPPDGVLPDNPELMALLATEDREDKPKWGGKKKKPPKKGGEGR